MQHPDVSYPLDPSTPTSELPFSPCVRVGDLVFVSGQASVDAKGNIVSDDFEGQFRRSIENLRAVLKTAGSDLQHIVQTRNYLQRREDWEAFNRLYAEYFSAPCAGSDLDRQLFDRRHPVRGRCDRGRAARLTAGLIPTAAP